MSELTIASGDEEIYLSIDQYSAVSSNSYLSVGAGNTYDWGTATVTLTQAREMRDWLTKMLRRKP